MKSKNLLILYNPYYQNDVIEQHLKGLIERESVAFGKVRSKFRDMENDSERELEEIYQSVKKGGFLQLFLTDYSNLFVAKVVQITTEDMSQIAPNYYKEKGLDVERWFIIEDLRELVRNDFETIRDQFLANFTTPHFQNHTYALYGNAYVYPLIIEMKREMDYFSSEIKSYPNVYKSKEFLAVKENLIRYSFGEKIIHSMHPDTIENIISAEIEYQSNKHNPLYDFSTVVVKYSKTMEQEIYLFSKVFFKGLSEKDSAILEIPYSVQGIEYKLQDIFTQKPNLGTYKFLIKNPRIQELLEACNYRIKHYISKVFPGTLKSLQAIRNESVHAKAPKLQEVTKLREKILGIAQESILTQMTKIRLDLLENPALFHS